MLQIDRVQNRSLWTKYALRKQEGETAAGETGAREAFLWRGADKGEHL